MGTRSTWWTPADGARPRPDAARFHGQRDRFRSEDRPCPRPAERTGRLACATAAPAAARRDPRGSLRALRAARFLAQLPRFALEPEARRQASHAGAGLRRASPERVRDELDKLLASADPARGLATLEGLGLVGAVLPELVPLASCVAGAERPDVWRHTLEALARSAPPRGLPGRHALRQTDGRRLLRWALLLHDISKPETFALREDGRPTFHGHEVLGVRRSEALLVRLRVSKDARRRIGRLILNHLRPSQLAEAGAPARGMRRLVREAGEDLPLLVVHAACDAQASGAPDHIRRWRRLRRVLRRADRVVGTANAVAATRAGRRPRRDAGTRSRPRKTDWRTAGEDSRAPGIRGVDDPPQGSGLAAFAEVPR